jgi:hypothetical protein
MRRRDLIKSGVLISAGAVAGVGGLWQFSGQAAAAGRKKNGAWASELGQPLAEWPLIPVHAVLLGNGQLLTYGTGNPDKNAPDPAQQTGYFIYDIWDPDAGLGVNSHFTLPNTTRTDLFCSAQIVLPQSGNVLIAGGDNFVNGFTTNTGNNNSNIFDPSNNNSLTRSNNMNRPRWYGSPTTLPDGRIYIQGGNGGSDYPEIRELDGTFRLVGGVNTSSLAPLYPRNRVAPDGRLFGYSDRSMYYVDLRANSGNGSITPVGEMPPDGPSGLTSTDVMYAPGKILRCGGGSNTLPETAGGPVIQAKNAAAVIDINGAMPTYKKLPSMPVSLHWANATVLADGNVVVTGGSLLANIENGVNYGALLWKADTGSWTSGASSLANKARLYHSIALLLPDGSVLSGGGGAPGPEANTDAEIYYPPYLFDNSGAFAARPTITSSPDRISYGQPFDVEVSSAARIQRVTFIKTSSVTHSINFEQRFIELSFTTPAAGVLSVGAPSSPFLATPGNYLLFVIDKSGVPSISSIVQIG